MEGKVWDHISCSEHSPRRAHTHPTQSPQLGEKCPASRCVSAGEVADSSCTAARSHVLELKPPVATRTRYKRLSDFLPLFFRCVLRMGDARSHSSYMCQYVWRLQTSTWRRWQGRSEDVGKLLHGQHAAGCPAAASQGVFLASSCTNLLAQVDFSAYCGLCKHLGAAAIIFLSIVATVDAEECFYF